MSNLRRVGREAEDRAAEFLIQKGLTIVTRRYARRGVELDLIALDGDVLAFIEVRTRRDGIRPEETIGAEKIRRLLRSARTYLREMGEEERAIRFDIVAIDKEGVRHLPNAFDLDDISDP